MRVFRKDWLDVEIMVDEDEELVILEDELEDVKLEGEEEVITDGLDVEDIDDVTVLVEGGEIVAVTIDDVVLVDGFVSKTPPTAAAATTIITTTMSATTVRLIALLLFKITLGSVAPVQDSPVI